MNSDAVSPVVGEVAAERHDVDHARVEIVLQKIAHLVTTVTDADEMGHGRHATRRLNLGHQVVGALARLSPASIGHRDERGVERGERVERALEHHALVVRLWWKELERASATLGEEIVDSE